MTTRTSWRALAVVIGVALCSAYATGTMALVEGLRSGTEAAASRMTSPPVFAYRGPDLTGSSVEPADLAALKGPFAAFRLTVVGVTFAGGYARDSFVLAVEDGSDLAGLGWWQPHSPHEVSIGKDLWSDVREAGGYPEHLTMDDLALTAEPYGNQTVIPNDWILVSGELMDRLPQASSTPSFLLLPEGRDAYGLANKGYRVVPAAGSLTFLKGSIGVASSALLSMVAATAVATLLLVSTLLGLEVRYRAREFRLIGYLGGSPGLITGLILGQALYITLLGALLGTALGIMAAHGLVSLAPYLGLTNVIQPRAGAWEVLLGLALVPMAGMVGVLGPIARIRRGGIP